MNLTLKIILSKVSHSHYFYSSTWHIAWIADWLGVILNLDSRFLPLPSSGPHPFPSRFKQSLKFIIYASLLSLPISASFYFHCHFVNSESQAELRILTVSKILSGTHYTQFPCNSSSLLLLLSLSLSLTYSFTQQTFIELYQPKALF